ncbi:MAG: RNA polymerase sigma-70 factor [Flavobacteriales bacterium]
MNALQQGDQQAFKMLFDTWYNPLCNFAYSFRGDKPEAEELVQNAFVNFWEKRNDIHIESSLKSYLYRSVRNACLNALKHDKVKRQHRQYAMEHTATSAEDVKQVMIADELTDRINQAMSKLPEQCGLVFKLSRMHDLKYAEIAAELDISIKTVENHMGKALRIMREELKEFLTIAILILTSH